MKVPFLQKSDIAEKASDLIQDYQALLGRAVSPPIPVEDIIERHLKLNLDYIDFTEPPDMKIDMKNVFGATYVRRRLIAISKNLLNDTNEGRLCFTCAHETGHWVLHSSLIETAARTGRETGTGAEAVFCREKDARTPAEWQADYFASCLLMPEEAVRAAFKTVFGSEALDMYNIKQTFPSTPFHFDICVENWRLVAEAVRLAGDFLNVSKQAMIIRLQNLGLIINHTGRIMTWHRHERSI
jgi:hypothetical protein